MSPVSEPIGTVVTLDGRAAGKRANLPHTIAEELRRRVHAGELEPGAKLPGHRELAILFSVSVGSVREALSMLMGDGLIETHAGRGTFVSADARPAPPPSRPFGRHEIEQLIEWREVLELQSAVMAAKRATPEQLQRLSSLVDEMDAAASDPGRYPDADVEFHVALAEASGNRYVSDAITAIRPLLKSDMELGAAAIIGRFGSLDYSVASHRRILAAVAAGDAEGAREELLALITRHREFVLSLYALGLPELERGS